MRIRRALGYFFREAASDLWKRRTVNLISISTIGATLYVVGLFLVMMANLGRVVSSWAEENRISVYLADEVTEADRTRISEKIAGEQAVKTVHLVGKEEALASFRQDFPDLADLAGGLDANPLPASFEITLKKEAADPAAVEALASDLRKEAGVEGVRYDIAWVRRVRTLLTVLGWGGAILGTILMGAAVITISGVVRLNVMGRREEIEILRLVGATRRFIRGPFLVEGAFQGLAASVLAILLIVATWVFALSSSWVRNDMLLSVLTGSFMPLWTPAALMGVGLAVGLTGSLISVRRVFVTPTRSS